MQGDYFGGGTQFAGTGFMPSPAAGNENAYGAGGQRRSGASSKKEETLRAVVIKQILTDAVLAEEDTFVLDGHPCANVCIVGRILDVVESAAKLTFRIHDNTGELEALMHSPTGSDGDEVFMMRKRELVPNTYVRVCGTLRQFQGRTNITVYNIRPIQDFNEVSFHNLQVVFQHLHLTQGARKPLQPTQAGAMAGTMPYGGAMQSAAPYGAGVAGVMGGGGNVGMGAGGMMEKTGDITTDMMSVFNAPMNTMEAQGVSMARLEEQLKARGAHYATHQIRAHIEHLINEGRIYNTIEDCWRSCEN